VPTKSVLANATIHSITMLSATDGWAVGTTNVSPSGVILHYTGGRWVVVPVSLPGVGLAGISMVSPAEGWAVGSASSATGMGVSVILHYHDGAWTSVPNQLNGQLVAVQMVSATEGWAIGSANSGSSKFASLVVHYSNGVWTAVDNNLWSVAGISMVSPHDGWIVGNNGSVGHYQNGQWVRWGQSPPGTLNGVDMLSASNGWAVGTIGVSGGGPMLSLPFIQHFNGASWDTYQLPSSLPQGNLYAVAMTSANDGWAVGETMPDTSPPQSLLLHYQNGQWSEYNLHIGYGLSSISMVSANDGWAVGTSNLGTGGDVTYSSVILHYQNGRWSVYNA